MLVLTTAFALFAYALVPRGIEAEQLLAAQDDPAALADRALTKTTFDIARVTSEIDAALAANDADLARSFLELARERGVHVPPELAQKVETAVAQANSASAVAQSFARGFVTGEPEDLVGLSGTLAGDLFVFGDIRDAVREGTRLATGEKADELLLGLACVGLAITAGTYATLGAGAPARVGLSVVKAARKTGRLGARMATWIGRSVREVVDWSSLRRAIGGASLAEPAVAIARARQAVKVEKAGGLLNVVKDVGRVQSKAGTRAALDGLKIAEGPRDVARVAKLAESKGGKTRAILKTARPRRYCADDRELQSHDVDVLGDPRDLRLRIVAQGLRRARDSTRRSSAGARSGGRWPKSGSWQRRVSRANVRRHRRLHPTSCRAFITVPSRSRISTRARANRSSSSTALHRPRRSTGSTPAGSRR